MSKWTTTTVILLCLALSLTASQGVSGQQGGRSSLTQSLALELARQEMVAQRLDDLIASLAYLAADAESNGEVGQLAEKDLAQLINRMRALRGERLASARNHLRQALDRPGQAERHLARARVEVDDIARKLGSMLLHAGISRAEEVFVDELNDMSGRLEDIQNRLMQLPDGAEAGPLATGQENLADRLSSLLEEIDSLGLQAEEPLPTVRVRQTRTLLIRKDGAGLLRRAAQATRTDRKQALALQSEALGLLAQAQRRLYPEAALHTLVRARSQLKEVLDAQIALREQIEGLDAGAFDNRRGQFAMRQEDLGAALAPIGAVADMAEAFQPAQKAAETSAQRLGEADREAALKALVACEDAIREQVDALNLSIRKLQRPAELYVRMQDATAQMGRIQALVDRVGELIDETDKALAEGEDVSPLAAMSLGVRRALERFDVPDDPEDRWGQAIASDARHAAGKLLLVTARLTEDKGGEALDIGHEALDALEELLETSRRHTRFLEQMWSLADLGRDMRTVSRHSELVRREQANLITDLQDAEDVETAASEAVPLQQMLSRAVAELQDLVSTAADARSTAKLLGQARGSMDAAVFHLDQGNREQAVALLQTAVLNLEQTEQAVDKLVERAEYMSRMLESMGTSAAMAVRLLQRQMELRQRTEQAEEAELAQLSREQEMLQSEAVAFDEALFGTYEDYAVAAGEMGSAVRALNQTERETAIEHQLRAEDALRRARDQLYDMLESLEMATEEVSEPLDWPAGMDLVQRTVILIVEQIELRERTRVLREKELAEQATVQEKLRDETRIARDLAEETMENDEGGEALAAAAEHMTQAMFGLQDAKRPETIEQQFQAEKELRRALAQLLATTFPIPVDEEYEEEEEEESEAGAVIEPISPMDPEGSWRVFFQTSPTGKAVAKTSSEWESLTEREREALNENFARELPLEFRQMLRDYYTELSKMR